MFSHNIKLEEVLKSHIDNQTVLETLLCRFILGGVIVKLSKLPKKGNNRSSMTGEVAAPFVSPGRAPTEKDFSLLFQ